MTVKWCAKWFFFKKTFKTSRALIKVRDTANARHPARCIKNDPAGVYHMSSFNKVNLKDNLRMMGSMIILF